MKFQDFRVLTDENISPKVVRYLRKMGIDVLDTKEQNWYGKEDDELLEIAFREQRLVVTHDSDFGTLAINEGKRNYGIIYFRLRNVNPNNVTMVYGQLLQSNISFPLGTILVVEETKIRIRYPSKEV